MKLSIIVPVLNEERYLQTMIDKICQKCAKECWEAEVIIVDDGSTDRTPLIIAECERKNPKAVKAFVHLVNRGKGAALRTGLAASTGDIILFQDADLEYEPENYTALLGPLIRGKADVVYGSRFAGSGEKRVLLFWHMVGNRLVTFVSNVFTNINLTDIETGHKAFRREVLEKIQLEEDGFGVEPEITAKIARLRCAIYEVGITYHGRTYAEGKKIKWYHGISALACIIRYNTLR